MFTATTTPSAAPTVSTTTITPTSPTSPTRASRLRGLSYLRHYTRDLHNRSDGDSNSRNSRPGLSRTRSQPLSERASSPTTEAASTTAQAPVPVPVPAPAPRRAASPPTTSGWAPSANTPDGSTRIRQQSASSEVASAAPAPTVTTAEATPAQTMTRTRADTAEAVLIVRNQAGPRSTSADANNGAEEGAAAAAAATNPLSSIRFIPHYDPRANRPSLSFPAVTRTLPNSHSIIRVGRYSERDTAPDIPANAPSSAPVGFKSKVVSRRHCEFWSQNGQWYVKDVKSSSGTFLNHLRLSPPGVESKAFPVNDGDVVQLGIDFRGGEEMIFRCVKIRVECNRGWQKHLNNFNKKTHQALLARATTKPTKKDADSASVNSSECSICLMSISPCQSLFVAPCSHVWHYKCIRPILNGHTWPNFLCPNCRAVADLEADVDDEEDEIWEEDEEDAEEEIAATSQDAGTQESGSQAVAGATTVSRPRSVTQQPDGLRTPEAMHPVSDISANATTRSAAAANQDGSFPSDLADFASALSLANEPPTRNGHSDSPSAHRTSADQASRDQPSRSALSIPLTIPTRTGEGSAFESAPGATEGVMTPRNDAGPFVFDGGAGRASTTHRGHAPTQSIDATTIA